MFRRLIVIVLVATGCLRGEDRPARATYNAGIAALAGSNYSEAEDQLVKARSEAGVDPELRYRAAYDLGLAFAAHADKVKSPANEGGADLKKALELEQEAVWWFGDALRIREKDPDATANLAIVRARMQAISDELHKDEAKLEVRLDQLIVAQRKVLDGVRAAWKEVAKLGGRDPLAQQGNLVALADQERGIVAEAGTIGDVAADEIEKIGKKPQDKREAQEQARLAQLKSLDHYVAESRARIGETRRELQQLSADTAVVKAEAALLALKRAREQLDDPITVLQHALQDELALDGETHQAQVAAGGSSTFGAAQGDAAKVDKWLEYTALAGRQSGIRDRVDEVRARLQGAADQKPEEGKPVDPKQEKLMAQVRAALPSVVAATMAMSKAHDTLLEKQWKAARDAESEAALALFAAIEQFADLKRTVDLAYASHQELQALLAAPDVPELTAAERGKRVGDDLAGNLARLDRLTGLIADALADVKDPEPPKADPKDPKAPDPKAVEAQLEAAKAQVAQQRAMFARAEELRAKAKGELQALEKAIATNGDAIGAAKTADATLDELRRLFFDVIEHLQQLARDQGETRDRTTKLADADELARQDQLPGLTTRQGDHGTMAKEIADALAKQADELAKQGNGPASGPTVNQPGQPSPAERAKALSGAVAEVRSARNDMSDASAGFAKGKTSSLAVDPIAKSQASAIDHLVKALQLLQPPPKKQDQKQDQQKQDQQKQDQQKQDQQKQDQQKQDEQKQQQGGAGQRARDEDAKRQKAKQDRNAASDAVDQDW